MIACKLISDDEEFDFGFDFKNKDNNIDIV